MSRALASVAGLTLLGAAVGFAFGFAWGQGTRSKLADATKTNFASGVLTVQVDTGQALSQGLASIFGG